MVRLLVFLGVSVCVVGSRAQSSDTLRLSFVGDIMGHGPQIRAAQVVKDSLYDFSPNYRYVQPLLERADLAVGNLEVALMDKPPYTGYPRFRSPEDLARDLRYAGFDLLVTANNHSNDGGRSGVLNTIETLDEWGFYHTGTFVSQTMRDALYPLIVYKNDFKLVFLNATYGTNGIPTPAPVVVNEIDTAQIKVDLALARLIRPDFVIMVMHWGDEYQRTESKAQRELARQLLHWGADAVIGAHPHVVQPVRYEYPLNDSTRTAGLVAYSLGNFISNQKKAHTDGGLLLEVELVRDDTGTRVGGFGYVPVYRHIRRGEDGRSTYFAVPPTALLDEAAVQDLQFTEADRAKRDTFYKNTRKHLGTGERQ